MIAADGHTYERIAIEKWLTKSNQSPKTNLRLAHKTVIPNHALRSVITQYCVQCNLTKMLEKQ